MHELSCPFSLALTGMRCLGRLQFASPLSMDGVTGVIIWGSEGNTTGRKELLQWFKKQSAVFGGKDEPEAAAVAQAPEQAEPSRNVRSAAQAPPIIPRDGPIPKYRECGL